MPKEFSRTQRVADLIQRELAQLIQNEMEDPRVRLVTVTAVKVSRDLSHAKIYITQHKPEAEIAKTVKVLNKAASFLRFRLAQIIDLRIVPELRFVYDASITYAASLSALIDEAVADDKKGK